MCSFSAKYILLELKKYTGVIFHETEEVYKIFGKNRLAVSKLAQGIRQILT